MLPLILCSIMVLFKKNVSISNFIPIFVYTAGDTFIIFSFKMILVCLQHNFHCLKNTTVNQINFSPLIICLSMSNVNFINKWTYLEQNISVKLGKISHNGGLYIAMITCDMIISKETGQYYLQYQFKFIRLSHPEKGKTKLYQVKLELI